MSHPETMHGRVTRCSLPSTPFHRVFGESPKVHGAAGWQINEHVPTLEAELGFEYASDTRGAGPTRPMFSGKPVSCPQLPTTLPTFDEVIAWQDAPKTTLRMCCGIAVLRRFASVTYSLCMPSSRV